MAMASGVYVGSLRCEATHTLSGTTIVTDAPVDNQGKGEAFSPTDLVATALATCIITTMGIVAARDGFSVDGATFSIDKVMAPSPRRIETIGVAFDMPALGYSDNHKKLIIATAHACPVAKSLHPDLHQKIVFNWL